MKGDTYLAPAHGWTCFHCGETFTKYGDAWLHFGPDPEATPACKLDKGALMDLRAAERRVAELQALVDSIADQVHDYAYTPPRLTVRDPDPEELSKDEISQTSEAGASTTADECRMEEAKNGANALCFDLDTWERIKEDYEPEPSECLWEGELPPEKRVLAILKEKEHGRYLAYRFITVDRVANLLLTAGVIEHK